MDPQFAAFEVAALTNSSFTDTERLVAQVLRISGVLLLLVWLFAQLPQIIENHLNESVDGVSMAFLACWIGGDVTNLVGCVLTGALPFQKLLAAYYCFIDFILSLQFWYYTRVYPRQKVHHNLLQSPNMMRPVTSHHNSHSARTNRFHDTPDLHYLLENPMNRVHKRKGSFVQRLMLATLLSGGAGKASAAPTAPEMPQNGEKGHFYRQIWAHLRTHLSLVWVSLTTASLSTETIGVFSAWSCSVLYLSLRSPQIYKNFLNRSTKGISPWLFVCTMAGNFFYTISVISDLYLLAKVDEYMGESKFHEVLLAQTPFIVGSAGTMVFDAIILGQCWLYRDFSTSRKSSYVSRSGSHRNTPKSLRKRSSEEHHLFQQPDWYTITSQPQMDLNDFEDAHITETSSLFARNALNASYPNSYTLHSPPPHYIKSSSLNAKTTSGKLAILSTLTAITKSISGSSNANLWSPSSRTSSHSPSVHTVYPVNVPSNQNGSFVDTSLLPSLIGSYSLVLKKMMSEQKVPFLPSDFLQFDGSGTGSDSMNHRQGW